SQFFDDGKKSFFFGFQVSIQIGHKSMHAFGEVEQLMVFGAVAHSDLVGQLLDDRALFTYILMVYIVDIIRQKAKIPTVKIMGSMALYIFGLRQLVFQLDFAYTYGFSSLFKGFF